MSLRLDSDTKRAIEKYREKHEAEMELREFSDAARNILRRKLKEEGLL